MARLNSLRTALAMSSSLKRSSSSSAGVIPGSSHSTASTHPPQQTSLSSATPSDREGGRPESHYPQRPLPKSASQVPGGESRDFPRPGYLRHMVCAGALAAIASAAWSMLGETNRASLRRGMSGLLPVVHAAEAVAVDEGQPPASSSSSLSRRSRYNFIADVVQDVAAALVYIEIKDLGVRDYFTGLPVTSSNGSGFVVREDGLILTNAHVVINKPNASVQVRLQDGRTFTGIVEDVDVRSDLATVRIPCQGLPVMPLGESSTVRPGEFVIAMGSPLSLSNTITTGVVSTVSRQRAELGLRDRDVPEYIQTDAAITFGNSGGPLVNLDGEAIGINSMKVTPGISFAIPIDYAKEFLRKSDEARKAGQLKKKQGDRRYMGITMLTITPQIIEELKARLQMPSTVRHGIVIFRIVRSSPADIAGLLPGDIVTHINGLPIHGSNDVYKLLESEADLKMKVVRKDQYLDLTVRPEPAE